MYVAGLTFKVKVEPQCCLSSVTMLVFTGHQCLDLIFALSILHWAKCSPSTQQDELAPTEVQFHSLDFQNVLHWKHLQTGKNQKYFVQYKIYGEKAWSNADHCQGIQSLKCDLTRETSDPREWYYARVRSLSPEGFSSWILSHRFYPQWESQFSPPKIKATVAEQTITVQIIPPRTPMKGPKRRRIRVTKLQKLTFRIYLLHNDIEEEVHETDSCSKKLEIRGLRPETTYCLQALSVTPRSGRQSSRSPRTCIRTH
ncbi:hypothetical protein DNTS_008354 [Danionella cerebrum]|uniref:Fibronectin type-III domain-containing protein n=1 Tax=Danionella cerebrum TaxID=2873325 RepID=A0A553RN93_9TELE|nr:hypothetical protein DNTS_008354 [Danionella translucida]